MRFSGKLILILISVFLTAGCGTEPNIHNTVGGKMMKRVSAFTTYARNSPTNLFYSAAVADGVLFAGSEQGLLTEKNGQLERIPLDGLDEEAKVRVFRLHPTVDAKLGKVMYAATAAGLFRYTFSDKKTKRLTVDAAEAKQPLQFLSVTTDENGTIYAGTYKNGLYISADGGSTWIHHAGSDFKLYTGRDDLTYDGYKKAETADPSFPERAGIIKIEPHYRGEMKSTTVTDISVYGDRIYTATFGGGLSYTRRPDSFTNWKPYWMTYLRPWYFFETTQAGDDAAVIDANREAEADWTMRSRYVHRVNVQPFGIFAATDDGISFTSHGESFGDRDTSDRIPYLDDFGHIIPVCNEENGPVYSSSVGRDNNGIAVSDQTQQIYRWPNVRLWYEYESGGFDGINGFRNEKEIDYIEEYSNGMVGAGLESDNFNALRFGQINGGKTKLFYAGTECGLSIAELRQYTDVTGQTYTSYDIVDSWVTYHNVLSALEETWVTDIAVAVDDTGDDKIVYAATNGQGVIVFCWED